MPDEKQNPNTGSSLPNNGPNDKPRNIDFGEPDILKHSWDHPNPGHSGHKIPEDKDVYKGSDE